ncbi:ribulose-phosphate 3-epimerase [candidate division KSB1 bacterium]|nr:ribulose-phosphate 3-epimerase [candidate division KSB1 bacterium]MBL7093347.1 ribulose-phosphate 3-epimerase [candidate division KSB1 bacterium]
MIKIAPSILAADISRLEEQLLIVKKEKIEWLHVDVMDGHFVPNLTFGPSMVKAVKKMTGLFMDVHLMVDEPDFIIPEFCLAGADMITVHVEAIKHLHRSIQLIKSMGAQAGVTLNPGTPAHLLDSILTEIDLVLVMSVNPGYGGQKFIPSVIEKIREISNKIKQKNLNVYLEVDGGITADTAPQVVKAGANVLVAGTSVFGQENIPRAISLIKESYAGLSK